MATNIFWYTLEISTNHLPTEVRTPYRHPRIVMLLESLQQNMATQRHRINTSCPKGQLENWSIYICRYWRKLV